MQARLQAAQSEQSTDYVNFPNFTFLELLAVHAPALARGRNSYEADLAKRAESERMKASLMDRFARGDPDVWRPMLQALNDQHERALCRSEDPPWWCEDKFGGN
jgi:hypothetical protein